MQYRQDQPDELKKMADFTTYLQIHSISEWAQVYVDYTSI